MFRKLLDSRYFIWALLALPSIPMILGLIAGQPGSEGTPVTEMLLHPTGESSVRFMILTMILTTMIPTPMRMLFPGSEFWRWMMKRRCFFWRGDLCLCRDPHRALHRRYGQPESDFGRSPSLGNLDRLASLLRVRAAGSA